MTDPSERECFSCGATQVEVRGTDLASARHVRLCLDCAETYRDAGLLAIPEPSDFAVRLTAAATPQITEPGPPSTG